MTLDALHEIVTTAYKIVQQHGMIKSHVHFVMTENSDCPDITIFAEREETEEEKQERLETKRLQDDWRWTRYQELKEYFKDRIANEVVQD